MNARVYQRCLPYAMAIGTVAIATVISLLLEPLLSRTIGAFFYLAVVISTWYGGFFPGITAIVLSTFSISYLFLPPLRQLEIVEPGDWVRLGIFALTAFSLGALSYALRMSKRKVEQLSHQLAQENAAQLRMALTAARMGMWDWDLVAGTVSWSPEHEQLFGLQVGEFDGTYAAFEACLHPADRESMVQAIQTALRDHKIYQNEFRVVWRDGSIHWIEGRGQAFYDDLGQPVRMTGTVMDIDLRKKSEQTLQQAQHNLQTAYNQINAIINNTTDLIAALDLNFCYIAFNRAYQEEFESIFGQAIAPGTNLLEVLENSPQSKERAIALWQRAFQGETFTVNRELNIAGRDRKDFELAFTPIYNEQHQQIGATHIVRDITERKRAEQQLQQLNRALRTLSECNQILVRTTDETALLQDVCRIIVEFGGYCIAWIGFAEQDEAKRVLPVAQAGYQEDYLQSMQISWADTERGRGPTGTAIRTGEVCIVQDILNDPLYQPWRDAALQRGYASSIALPLVIDQHPMGALNIYAAKPHAFPPEEVRLLIELSHDLAYGITTLRNRKALESSEERLKRTKAGLEMRVAERTAELTQANFQLRQELVRRQQVEAELKRYASEIEDLYNNAPCGYHSLDSDGKFVRINNTELRWLGYSREEIIGRPFSDLLTPDQQPLYQQRFVEFKQSGWVNNIEFELLCKDGSVLPVNLSATVVKDAKGNYLSSRSTLFDISKRKQVEVALQQSQARFAGILEIASDAIISVDSSQNIILFNQGAERIFGYSAEEVLGHPLSSLIPQRFAAEHRHQVSRYGEAPAHARRMGERGEIIGCRKDGTEFPAEASIAKLTLGGETIFTTILRDISDRKHAEAAMAQLAAIVDSSEDAIIGKALDGTIISWNKGATTLFGYTAAEMIGRPVDVLIPSENHEEEARILEKIKHGEPLKHYETTRLRKDGSIVDISLTISPVKDAKGAVIGASKIARDITESKAIERMKTEFVSIVSHELRTPLTAIRGSLGLIANRIYDKKPDKKQRMIEIAAQQTDRLVRLVNDILDLQRLESGRVKLVMQNCDAAVLMQQSADTMRLNAEENQLQIVVHPVHAQVWADPDALVQVLTNLLSNAIKFSFEGQQIWLSAALQEQAMPPTLLFAVKDHGRGIPTDKLETVFERFQQIDASDSRQKGGTGLGLAICRRIVEQHNGHIWAENNLDAGTTFYFTVPLGRDRHPT